METDPKGTSGIISDLIARLPGIPAAEALWVTHDRDLGPRNLKGVTVFWGLRGELSEGKKRS
jgi:hypothetical protein